jgi:hypothetical protein
MERIYLIEESGTYNRKIDRHRELDVPKAATKIMVKLENMRLVFVSRWYLVDVPRLSELTGTDNNTDRCKLPLGTVLLQVAAGANKRVDCPEGAT